jgi:hypothetical protein
MAGRTTLAGIDDQGREVLSFIDGHVAWEPGQPPEVRPEESLVAVARLVRQFHDLTAGTELAHDQEVACHNDLSPKNTVYRDLGADLRPTASGRDDPVVAGPLLARDRRGRGRRGAGDGACSTEAPRTTCGRRTNGPASTGPPSNETWRDGPRR